jgi:hypothetical protein
MPQYCQITLDDAISLYQSGDLTAKGLIKLWAHIRLKEGWKVDIVPADLCNQLQMKPSTFRDAFAKLKAEGEITVGKRGKVTVERISVALTKTCQPETENRQELTENRASLQNSVTDDEKLTNQSLEALPDKKCSSSSDSSRISINSLSSLSQEEREKFESFVSKEYGKPIKNFSAFMSGKHFNYWWDRYTCAIYTVDWASYPKIEEWKKQATEMPVWFIHEGDRELTKNQRIALVDSLKPQQQEVA